MKMQYKQLTLQDREKIYQLHQKDRSVDSIADSIGCHRSTIYRELNRNKSKVGYLPDRAQKLSLDRCKKGELKIDRDPKLKKHIMQKLHDGWSPEIISGHLKKERGITVISHETIYAYIYSKEGCANALYLQLTKRRKKRKSKSSRKNKTPKIPNRVSIHDRPSNIDKKTTYGHWEGDLMIFSDTKTNLITLRERKSRMLLAIKNPTKHSDVTSKNIINKFKGRKKILIQTLTLDNGGEFSKHEDIAKQLRIDTFFCDPYSSYQKGSVENGNGVLRYDLPRSIDIDSLSQKQIDKIIDKINNRPMKCLGFRTPAEVFRAHYGKLVVNGAQ